MPDARISGATTGRSTHGSGIPAMGGARGSATPTDVTITGSAEGDVATAPGSPFVFDR
ncbi:hypothetical protein ACF1AE_24585 [Streptomyces sp. NPDC014986]|uniref:hypothetical protein n=1 Tax=Streptomyces sp. NPDC014986 TaxID=3364934 RepID=UPI0036FFF7DC